jgi:hypothetical protein
VRTGGLRAWCGQSWRLLADAGLGTAARRPGNAGELRHDGPWNRAVVVVGPHARAGGVRVLERLTSKSPRHYERVRN